MAHIRPKVRPRLGYDSPPKRNFNPNPQTFLEKLIFKMSDISVPLKSKPFVPIKECDAYVDTLKRHGMDEAKAEEIRARHLKALKLCDKPGPAPVKIPENRPLVPVKVNLKIENDYIKLELDTGSWTLYDKYHSKCMIPPFIAILRAYSGAPAEYKAKLMKIHQRQKERIIQMEEDFRRLFPDTKKAAVVKKALKAVKKV